MRSTATTKAQARSHTTTTRYEVRQNVTAARVGKIETRPYLPFTDLNPCLPGFFLSLQALAEMDEGFFFAPEDTTLEEKLLIYPPVWFGRMVHNCGTFTQATTYYCYYYHHYYIFVYWKVGKTFVGNALLGILNWKNSTFVSM